MSSSFAWLVLSGLFIVEVLVFGVGVGDKEVFVSKLCSAADLTDSGRSATRLACNSLIVSCQSTKVSEAVASVIGVVGLDVLDISNK